MVNFSTGNKAVPPFFSWGRWTNTALMWNPPLDAILLKKLCVNFIDTNYDQEIMK